MNQSSKRDLNNRKSICIFSLSLIISLGFCLLLASKTFSIKPSTTQAVKIYNLKTNTKRVATLTIPSINIKTPVYNKTTKANLAKGATQQNLNSRPGQIGNYIVLGHNMVYSHVLFTNLKYIKPNANIYFKTNKHVYLYRVIWVKQINTKHKNYLARSSSSVCTLYTCLDSNKQSQRFMVRAKLIK